MVKDHIFLGHLTYLNNSHQYSAFATSRKKEGISPDEFNRPFSFYKFGQYDISNCLVSTTRATLSVAAYARHIPVYFQLESAVRFEPYKVT